MPNPTTQPSQAAREAGASLLRKIGRGLFSTHLDTASEAFARFEHDTEKRVRESLAGEANVERVAQRIERAPVRIYRTSEEARAYMLGRADAVALVRAKLVGDVDDHIAALATLERTTDAG